MNDIIQTIAVYALPVIFAITLHEAAHGYVARLFGDPTAYQAGRISLNPARHIDPVGTLLVPVAILLASKLLGSPGMLFGWAKPVPVDFGRLRRPKQDMLWVALAGPAANMLMAVLWALALRLFLESGMQELLVRDGRGRRQRQSGIDGAEPAAAAAAGRGRIVFSLLPNRLAWQYSKIEPTG